MQRAEKKKRKVVRYKGSKEYRVPAAKVQLADSPLFEHAGLLFLSVSLPPPFHSSLTGRMLLAMRARARVYAPTPRVTRDLCVRVCTRWNLYTRCTPGVSEIHFSISENRLSSTTAQVPPRRLFSSSKRKSLRLRRLQPPANTQTAIYRRFAFNIHILVPIEWWFRKNLS